MDLFVKFDLLLPFCQCLKFTLYFKKFFIFSRFPIHLEFEQQFEANPDLKHISMYG